jgi:hypothetical protein
MAEAAKNSQIKWEEAAGHLFFELWIHLLLLSCRC